jgi:hypothetical protein
MRRSKRWFRIVAATAAVAVVVLSRFGVSAAGIYDATITDVTVLEGDTANFTVSLSKRVDPGDQITVTLEARDGTATYGACPGSDVDPSFATTPLVFGPGEQSKIVPVDTCDDSVTEDEESFFVDIVGAEATMCNPSPGQCAATFTDPEGAGTIADDDESGSITVEDAPADPDGELPEGDSGETTFTHTIRLSVAPGADQEVTITCVTVQGTASAGSDYTSKTGDVVFSAGERTERFTVQVKGDTTFEPDETYEVRCSDPESTGATPIPPEALPTFADDTGTGTITNDDLSATPTPTADPRTYEVTISDVGVTEGAVAHFLISLDRPVQGGDTVKVTVEGREGTADLGACGDPTVDAADTPPTVVTFTGGQQTMALSVDTCDDSEVEGADPETFFIDIVDPSTCTATAGSCTTVVDDAEGIGSITDDDTPGTLAVGDAALSEGDVGNTEFNHTIRLTGQALDTDFSVTCTVQPGTTNPATSTIDYDTPADTTVEFPAGQRSARFTVDVNGDVAPEANETYEVKCTNPTSPDVEFADDTGLGTILNDDGVPPATPTPTPTPFGQTPSPTPFGQTPSPTPFGQTPSPTPTPTPCPTASPTPTPTASPTASPTGSPTGSPTASPTASASATPSASPSPTPCPTTSPTASPSGSATASPTSSASASPSTTPTCTASDTTPARGDSVALSCSGWAASSTATITFQSDPVLLATVTTSSTGTISRSVTIPLSATAGSHSLVIAGTAADGTARSVSISLTVTGQVTGSATPTNATSTATAASPNPVPVSTGTPTLPRTGFELGKLVTLGLIFLALGWTAIELARPNTSQALWSVATERFASAVNFGGHDNRPRPSRIARLVAVLRRRRD